MAYRLNAGLVEDAANPGVFNASPVTLVSVDATPVVLDPLVLDTAQAALTPADALLDTVNTNAGTVATSLDQSVADLATKINAIVAVLVAAGIATET